MEFFHGTNIDFIGKRIYYFGFTVILTVVCIFAFIKNKGPVLGLEFTGGTLLQVGFKQLPPIDEIRKNLDADGWKNLSLQTQPANQSLIIKVKGDQTPK